MEKWTPEQLGNQAKRTEHDTELIKKGAEYVMDEGALEPRLKISEDLLEKFSLESKIDVSKILIDRKGLEFLSKSNESSEYIYEATAKYIEDSFRTEIQKISSGSEEDLDELFKSLSFVPTFNNFFGLRGSEKVDLSFGTLMRHCGECSSFSVKKNGVQYQVDNSEHYTPIKQLSDEELREIVGFFAKRVIKRFLTKLKEDPNPSSWL